MKSHLRHPEISVLACSYLRIRLGSCDFNMIRIKGSVFVCPWLHCLDVYGKISLAWCGVTIVPEICIGSKFISLYKEKNSLWAQESPNLFDQSAKKKILGMWRFRSWRHNSLELSQHPSFPNVLNELIIVMKGYLFNNKEKHFRKGHWLHAVLAWTVEGWISITVSITAGDLQAKLASF